VVGRGERAVCPRTTSAYTLDVVDLAGRTEPRTVTVAVRNQQPPTVAFWADRTAVNPNECTTLRWNVEGVRAVYLRTPESYAGVVGQGERAVCPRTSTAYTLDVIDLSGATTPHTVTVAVQGYPAPTVAFWADRTAVYPGECTTLRWNVEGVRAVYLRTPDVYVGVVGQGERGVCPRTSTAYTLEVVDLAGVTTARTVMVRVPP
jgi:hypothetical protein